MADLRVLKNELDSANDAKRYSLSRMRSAAYENDKWGVDYWTRQVGVNQLALDVLFSRIRGIHKNPGIH